MPATDPFIEIHGARTHNLKDIHLQIPHHRLVVITGRSGSGKSSLAFNTLFAEGQRQYVESLSLYSRQFFDQIPRADVDLIEGLQPTLSLDQYRRGQSRRSTVGTLTEIYDFVRVLYARAGTVHCFECDEPIQQQTPQQIRDWLLELPAETKVMLLAPMLIQQKGDPSSTISKIRRERLVRIRLNGEIHDIDRLPEISPKKKHTVEAVTDRVIIREGIDNRLLEAIELGTRLSNGLINLVYRYPADHPDHGDWQERLLSTQYACPKCDIHFAEVQPRTFSFNSPYGACPDCDGLGMLEQFDTELIISDLSLSLGQKAVLPWRDLGAAPYKRKIAQLNPLLQQLGVSVSTPLAEYAPEQLQLLLHSASKSEPGLLTCLEKEWATSLDEDYLDELAVFRSQIACQSCNGTRLNQQANSVRYRGKTIGEVTTMSLERLAHFFSNTDHESDPDDEYRETIAAPLIREIQKRISFLNRVGVNYLNLSRAANTLSGGELQRVRLATSIGNSLTNVCYVLDEPSIGLHPRDNLRLIETIRELQQAGNTVVVVEHDEAMIRAADHLIDIGPEAGKQGGYVVATGTVEDIGGVDESLTGRYLAGKQQIETPESRRTFDPKKSLRMTGARGFNLQQVNVQIPLGTLTAVTGISGSGKSTLINKTLYPAVAHALGQVAPRPEPFDSIEGWETIDRLVFVDQRPIGRSSRGCAATYTGVMNLIRKIFAATPLAKQRGYGSTRFSFNDKSGACPECKGLGRKQLKMNYLPDLEVVCEACQGARYNLQTRQVRFRGFSISDYLAMTIDEARIEFENIDRIHRVLTCLSKVGLGYLSLGQPANTLSGGEAQRIKLAAELATQNSGNTLYLLDEPTTGLHFEDLRQLLTVLNELVDLGNTVLVIEHNLDLIRVADWIIDLGPEGGERGGKVIATGTPEAVAEVSQSATGQYLKQQLIAH